MDKLLNEFTVNRPIGETWAVLTNVERIAPCMPGAELKEIEGDIFRGVVKVKLGAIATAFKGQAKFVELDEGNHRVVLQGEGRDTTGKGNADALVTAMLHPVPPDKTKVVIETELKITGKVAQFGRGIMGDVSKKLIAQFATNVNAMLDKGQSSGSTSSGHTSARSASGGTSPGDGSAGSRSGDEMTIDAPIGGAPLTVSTGTGAAAGSTVARPRVRKIDGPTSQPIELSGLAGGAILKRALPFAGGLVLLFVLVRRLRRR